MDLARELKKLWNMKATVIPLVILFTDPSAWAGYDTRSIFKRNLTGLNSEFSFSLTSCLTKAEELSLSYYLPIAGGRIIGFIPFPGVLALCEMQSVSSRFWTRVAVSICNWHARYNHQRINKGAGGLENKKASRDHLDYSIFKIGRNTQKIPGDFEHTCCRSNSCEKSSPKVDIKISQRSKY